MQLKQHEPANQQSGMVYREEENAGAVVNFVL